MWIATIQKAISSSSHTSTSNRQPNFQNGEGDEQVEILFNPTYQQVG